MAANGSATNEVAMIHAIQESGRTSNAHRWHLCSVAAQPFRLVACYRIVQNF